MSEKSNKWTIVWPPRSTAATAAFQVPLVKNLISDFMDQGDIYVGVKLLTTRKKPFAEPDAEANIITVYITARKNIIEHFEEEFTRIFTLYMLKNVNLFGADKTFDDTKQIEEGELQRAGYVCKKIEITTRFANRYNSFYMRHIQIYDQIQNFFFKGDWNGGRDFELYTKPKHDLIAKYNLITQDVEQVRADAPETTSSMYVGAQIHGTYTRDYVSTFGYKEGVHKHGLIYREVHKERRIAKDPGKRAPSTGKRKKPGLRF